MYLPIIHIILMNSLYRFRWRFRNRQRNFQPENSWKLEKNQADPKNLVLVTEKKCIASTNLTSAQQLLQLQRLPDNHDTIFSTTEHITQRNDVEYLHRTILPQKMSIWGIMSKYFNEIVRSVSHLQWWAFLFSLTLQNFSVGVCPVSVASQ